MSLILYVGLAQLFCCIHCGFVRGHGTPVQMRTVLRSVPDPFSLNLDPDPAKNPNPAVLEDP